MDLTLEALWKAASITAFSITLFLLIFMIGASFITRGKIFADRLLSDEKKYPLSRHRLEFTLLKDEQSLVFYFLLILTLNIASAAIMLSITNGPSKAVDTIIPQTHRPRTIKQDQETNKNTEEHQEKKAINPRNGNTPNKQTEQGEIKENESGLESLIFKFISILVLSFPFFYVLSAATKAPTIGEFIARIISTKNARFYFLRIIGAADIRLKILTPLSLSAIFSIGFSMIQDFVLFEGLRFNLFQLNNVAHDSFESHQRKNTDTTSDLAVVCDPKMTIGPFKSGSSSTLEDGIDLGKRIQEVERRLRIVQENNGLPLVLIIGSTDNQPLDKNLSKKFDSNSGLGQDRAMLVMKRLRNANTLSATMLALSTGPSHTTTLHSKPITEAESFRREDRSVKICFFSMNRSR